MLANKWLNIIQESTRSSLEQREDILKINPDLVYWVYNINYDFHSWELYDWEEHKDIELEMLWETLACYPNQLENLKWLNENSDVLIIDINELRWWKFKILAWEKNSDINFFRNNWSFKYRTESWHTMNVERNLCLLSNWVIELVDSEYKDSNWNEQKRTHCFTSLRDWWAADKLQRTSVAWRCHSDDVINDLEAEYTEESPFLWKKNWKYYLFTPRRSLNKWIKWRLLSILQNPKEIKSDLIESIKRFLSTKYNLERNNEEDIKFIKIFEKTFKWIKYEELWEILKDIIENDRIDYYDSKVIEDIPWIEEDMKNVIIKDFLWRIINKWKFFTFYDKNNNTFEYRQLRKINIPKWVKPNNKLYLESQNQWSKTHRIEDLEKENLVPAIKYFAERIK